MTKTEVRRPVAEPCAELAILLPARTESRDR